MTEEEKEAIRDRTDLVALVLEYLPLKQGAQKLKGQCPFHTDNTPSFEVNPKRGRWMCYSCRMQGDVFSFLQWMEGIDFDEAARRLSVRARETV